MLSHTRMASHMSIRIWDVPYAYGPIYAYEAEHFHYITPMITLNELSLSGLVCISVTNNWIVY